MVLPSTWFWASVVTLGLGVFLSPWSRTIPDDTRLVVQTTRLLWDDVEKETAIGRFSNALKVPTVADVGAANHVRDPQPFQELHRVLRADYAAVFARLEVEVVDDFSLLLTWPGTESEDLWLVRPI